MATINELSAVDTLTVSDLLAIWDASNGDTRKASIGTLVSYLESNLTFPNNTYTRQSYTVSATGTNVPVTDSGAWFWLFITQGANYAAMTITFPSAPVDQQEIYFKSTHDVTTLTLDGNGKTISTNQTAIDDIAIYRYKYDSTTATWYRIGGS